MASHFIITNDSRTEVYELMLNGMPAGVIQTLATEAFSLEPGKYEVSFRESEQSEVPAVCKSIQVTIDDEKTLRLKIVTHFFSINITDAEGTILNGKHGFLCGHIGDGIYVENVID
jgi:hypothetical protein